MKKPKLIFLLTPVVLILPLLLSNINVAMSKNDNNKANKTAGTLSEETNSTQIITEDSLQFKTQQYRIKKVVIDAGHGGYDTGCKSNAGEEKNNTLAMALSVGNKIKNAFPDIEIIYTRDKDEFIELHRRAEIANQAKADLFISIHCNSTDEGTGTTGTETYVLGNHKKEENLQVARRENSAILLEDDYKTQYDGFDPYSNEAYIIFSLFQNAYLDKSILLAKFVEQNFKNEAHRKSLGVKQAGFIVLKETAMPSILIETGFLNNIREGEFISSKEGQEEISSSIFGAFTQYKNAVETRNEPELVRVAAVSKTPDSYSTTSTDITYKIQLAISAQDISATDKLKNISFLEKTREGNVYKFYKTGLEDYCQAQIVLKKLRTQGFADAFIVGYKNDTRVKVEAQSCN